jgi:DNA-binding CsgD family transcriptional regulator
LTEATGTDWPLVGRREELEILRQIVLTEPPGSAVISGGAGVGKSRLARATLAEAQREGWATLTLRGSAGYASLPLGPLRNILPVPATNDLSKLTLAVQRELLAKRSGKGLIVLVDDCQDLDEASAGMLHQLVASGGIGAVVTARSGTAVPVSMTSLWKDGLAERIELESLSRRETAELLSAGLGGPVQDSSLNRIWQVTAGNPLYLREVVLSSREAGALVEVDGEWRWRGEWAKGARLQEIVAARLGRLDPEELTAMELLALAGNLPFQLVCNLTSDSALQNLEARGLVSVETSGRRLECWISHPLHAEVLRGRMPALQERSIRRTLSDALRQTGGRRSSDRVRLACWSVESGADVDRVTLSLGTDAVLFEIGSAISRRLSELLPEAAAGRPIDSGPPVRQNVNLAIRLGRTAFERTGGLIEGITLAMALSWAGKIAEAEAVLAELPDKAASIDERVRLEVSLAWFRFWHRNDAAGAEGLLLATRQAIAESREPCDPALQAELYQELAGIALNIGRPAEALEYAEKTAEVSGLPLSQSIAAPPAAAALAYLGRCQEAIELSDAAVPTARDQGHPLALGQLLFARAGALARMGRFEEARTMAEWLRSVALSSELLEATALFGVLLGEILLRQGRPASAARFFRDSAGLMAERDPLGYRPWALTGLARCKARLGDEKAADAALTELRLTAGSPRAFDAARHLAEVEVHANAGRTNEAVKAAEAGAEWTREAGMAVDEALLLHLWMGLAPSRDIAERLAALTECSDSQLVAVLAADAEAIAARDPNALLEVAERHAAMTSWWMAAEAASAAATLFERRDEARASKAAARLAAAYSEQCEGARSPTVVTMASTARLTKREREVATLAAAGRTSKEIAERMYLSPRTVDNHLYRAYMKLGVTDRAALADALSVTT